MAPNLIKIGQIKIGPYFIQNINILSKIVTFYPKSYHFIQMPSLVVLISLHSDALVCLDMIAAHLR